MIAEPESTYEDRDQRKGHVQVVLACSLIARSQTEGIDRLELDVNSQDAADAVVAKTAWRNK